MPVEPIIISMALLVAAVVVWRLARVWRQYRGQRLVTCPENLRPAGVVVDAKHAAASALSGLPVLRLSSCSRWPERAGCGQECLAKIAESPEDCLVRNILSNWYQGKICSSCGRPIGEIEWAGQKPALLGADQVSVEWKQIPADKLPEVLAAALPLCFACHMANTLVREHPELVVDRSASHSKLGV
ncbi:MAG TPA: hypothetical protein VKU19_06675 [Bryobacteraceae bacterium]|nr:hypothetical protein [Bryobacteraceae bacterium]